MDKKIFFVADAKSIHTMKWVDYFVEQKYDVFLATFATSNNTKCKNIYFLGQRESKVGGGNYHYLFAISKLAEILKRINPNIINAHYSYSMGLIALLAKRKANIDCKFSVVCHGSDVLTPPKPYIFDMLNKYVLKNSDKIFAVSDQIKDKIESFGVDIEKIFVGQYGLSTDKTELTKDIDILSNRSYESNSRIDFLLGCLDHIKDQNLNIVFVLPNISDSDFVRLKNTYSYIKFYKHLEYEKMIEFLNRTKIYISATKSDGTALSLLEALKLDCIPLISNIVSNRSWVLDSVNGYLFDGEKQFVKKLNDVLYGMSDEKRKKILNINSMLVESKGNYSKQMKLYELELKQLL